MNIQGVIKSFKIKNFLDDNSKDTSRNFSGVVWRHMGLALPELSGPSPRLPHVLCILYEAKGWAERDSGAESSLCSKVDQPRARDAWFL